MEAVLFRTLFGEYTQLYSTDSRKRLCIIGSLHKSVKCRQTNGIGFHTSNADINAISAKRSLIK